MADINFPVFPRSPENLVHLWAQAEAFQLPDYTIRRHTSWENTALPAPYPLQTSATQSPIKKYHYTSYPIAPSGIADNKQTSYNLPDEEQGFLNQLPTSTNFDPTVQANLNFTAIPPDVANTANKGNKSVPAYAIDPIVDPHPR